MTTPDDARLAAEQRARVLIDRQLVAAGWVVALKGGRLVVTEVVAQAHLFRNIRNYPLHPVEEHDADREAWLTETGATMLAIAASRYFLKLATLREALVSAPGVAPE